MVKNLKDIINSFHYDLPTAINSSEAQKNIFLEFWGNSEIKTYVKERLSSHIGEENGTLFLNSPFGKISTQFVLVVGAGVVHYAAVFWVLNHLGERVDVYRVFLSDPKKSLWCDSSVEKIPFDDEERVATIETMKEIVRRALASSALIISEKISEI